MQKEVTVNDVKYLYKTYSIWSSSLLTQGEIFFSLTLNLTDHKKFWPNDTFFNTDQEAVVWLRSFFSILARIDFIDCLLGSFVNTDQLIPQLKCVIGFRSHFNCLGFLKKKIEAELLNALLFDYTVEYLSKNDQILNFLKSLSKDFDKERKFPFGFFAAFSECFASIHREYIMEILVDDFIYFCKEFTHFKYFDWGEHCPPQAIPKGKHSDIPAIQSNKKAVLFSSIVYYTLYYFHKKDIILYNNNLYIKINSFNIS